MKHRHFWKLEYTITLFAIAAISVLMMPTTIKSTFQARLITKWKDCYSKLAYMKDAMNKHEQENMLAQLKRTSDKAEREKIITMIIKPYFRLKERSQSSYNIKYLNGSKVDKNDTYAFTDFYNGENNIIVGIKDIQNTGTEDAMFMMMFDINGVIPPNVWGKDIFGAKVYNDRVEPLGKTLPIEVMREDCSAGGTGVTCSYYYTIGGSFIE